MAKLTSNEKLVFRFNRDEMRNEDIQWAFCRTSGITIVFQEMPRGRFVRVSVAYCNPQDRFKKKIGLNTAMNRWQNGYSVQIPKNGCSVRYAIQRFADLITVETDLEFVEE